MDWRRRQILLDGLAAGVPLALLYALTLQRDIGIIDSGELAGVAVHLGIAHPTGYPIYSLLGRVAVGWASPGSELALLAGLSALAVVAASVLFVPLLRTLLLAVDSASGDPQGPGARIDAVARVGGLALGTSGVVWSQAVTNEVYGLHLLFVVLIAKLGLALMDVGFRKDGRTGGRPHGPTDGRTPGPGRTLSVLAYVVGLAGGHHLSIVFLGPATLFAVALWLRRTARSFWAASLGRALGFGLLGLSMLFYLPLRSAQEPLFDWGDPETLPSFLRHVGGAQYRVWHFQSSERFLANCGDYLTRFPDTVGWVFLALVPWGVYVLFRRRMDLGVYLGLVAGVAFVWASGYEIFDLEPYYLPVDVAAIAFGAVGAWDLVRRIRIRSTRRDPAGGGPRPGPLARRSVPLILVGLALSSLVLQLSVRYPIVDRSGDRVVRYHLETLLRTVPERAVLLSAFWDAVVSPLLYVQSVEHTRTDVTVVDPELLRRSWYYPQLERWDAELLGPIEPRISRFLTLLVPFETGDPFDAPALERGYRGIIEELAHVHRPERPTAFTAELVPGFVRETSPIPEGLVYVLRDSPADSPSLGPPDVDGLIAAGLRPDDRIHQAIVDVWVRMMRNRILYLERFGRTSEAAAWRHELEALAPYWAGEDSAGAPSSG